MITLDKKNIMTVGCADKLYEAVRSRSRKIDLAEFLGNLLPCIGFAKDYTLHSFVSDCIAGLTLALTVIPMGLGYADLAGLPLEVRH